MQNKESKESIADRKKEWLVSQVRQLNAEGITKAQIARDLGILPQALNNVLSSKRVSDKFIDRFCREYDIQCPVVKPETADVAGILQRIRRVLALKNRILDMHLLPESMTWQEAIGWVNCLLFQYPEVSRQWLLNGKGDMFEITDAWQFVIEERYREKVLEVLKSPIEMTKEEICNLLGISPDILNAVLDGKEVWEINAYHIRQMCREFGADPNYLLAIDD